MFTEEQLKQLRELLAPLAKGLRHIEDRLTSLEVQLQAHIQQSKAQHDELVGLVIDSNELADKGNKEVFSRQDDRITRLERHLSLPPLE